ncbi:MAG: hypothetical protein ACREFT_01905, partial [Acetobacteraceae bacterium]
TPASVRFLGRRVYVAMALMLISPPAGSAARDVAVRAVPLPEVVIEALKQALLPLWGGDAAVVRPEGEVFCRAKVSSRCNIGVA